MRYLWTSFLLLSLMSSSLKMGNRWCSAEDQFQKKGETGKVVGLTGESMSGGDLDSNSRLGYVVVLLWKKAFPRSSLAVQWLGLCAFTAVGLGSIPGRGTKIPQAMQCGQKKKIKKKNFNIYIWNKKKHFPSHLHQCYHLAHLRMVAAQNRPAVVQRRIWSSVVTSGEVREAESKTGSGSRCQGANPSSTTYYSCIHSTLGKNSPVPQFLHL